MPCYNATRFIEQAIDSVQAQSMTDWELIIIDDASTDSSREIITSYTNRDKRIKLIGLDKNQGAANARNKGIEYASGRYIAFLDSDDLWLPNKLEVQIEFMSTNNVALAYGSYEVINEQSELISTFHIPADKVSYSLLLKGSIIGNLTAVFDTKQVGKRYFKNCGHEDYVLWLELLKEIECAHGLTEVLARYRLSSNSLSGKKWKTAKWQWYIYRKIEKLGFVTSAYYFISYAYRGLRKYR